MSHLLVTVGTDGLTDWVRLPDGSKLSLGPVSVLQFISKLALSRRTTRLALDSYLAGKAVMFSVDDDRMWELLAPRRARWASEDDGPFMAPDQRTTQTGKGTMDTLSKNLSALEQHITLLDKHATTVSSEKLQEGHQILVQLTHKVEANQSDNSAYMNLGTPKVHMPTDAAPTPTPPETKAADEVPAVDGLTFDTIQSNKELASEILSAGEETVNKIDSLVAAGKKFAADRAKADVHAVTSKVASILQESDLTEKWVAEDLQKLASRAKQLHGLFVPQRG